MASSIANQFTGLPIENLIAAPLMAACEGQKALAQSTAQFISEVGMDKDGNTKSVAFKYEDGSESVALDVPLLSIINIPSLCVDEIDINFDMEVSTQTASKSSTDSSAELSVKAGFGCWSASFTGKVSHHSENSRKSDTSAKYSVSVKGKQEKPEGLMKVLDMLNNSIGKQKGSAPSDGQG
tara:strand:- start:30613 stop:31155 length:543 start_codon:yes stop_codon:yes gene_type:complete